MPPDRRAPSLAGLRVCFARHTAVPPAPLRRHQFAEAVSQRPIRLVWGLVAIASAVIPALLGLSAPCAWTDPRLDEKFDRKFDQLNGRLLIGAGSVIATMIGAIVAHAL